MKKILCAILILLGLISCSRLDLAVNLASSYIVNKTDDFFDLSREQSKWLRGAVDNDIERIKRTILPQLATELFSVADKISITKNFDSAMVLSSYYRVESLFQQTARVFSPSAVALADKITPEQIDYLKKEFSDKIQNLRVKPEKKSYDRMKKHFDSWMGAMNSEQKKELKNFIATNPPPISETIRHREAIFHGFINSYANRGERLKYVERLFSQYESMKDPVYAKVSSEKNRKVAAFVAKILSSMTEDQRKTLIATIRDRANQLVKISKG